MIKKIVEFFKNLLKKIRGYFAMKEYIKEYNKELKIFKKTEKEIEQGKELIVNYYVKDTLEFFSNCSVFKKEMDRFLDDLKDLIKTGNFNEKNAALALGKAYLSCSKNKDMIKKQFTDRINNNGFIELVKDLYSKNLSLDFTLTRVNFLSKKLNKELTEKQKSSEYYDVINSKHCVCFSNHYVGHAVIKYFRSIDMANKDYFKSKDKISFLYGIELDQFDIEKDKEFLDWCVLGAHRLGLSVVSAISAALM